MDRGTRGRPSARRAVPAAHGGVGSGRHRRHPSGPYLPDVFAHRRAIHGCVVTCQRRKRSSGPPGVSIQGEDLVERARRGDPGGRDARLARLASDRWGHGQALPAGRRRVTTPSLGSGHRPQEEREGTGRVAELSERARTDQALIHPTERLGDVAACGKREGACVPPGCLLWDAVPHPEYRAPMVAAGGRSWRCPLGTSAR